MPILNLILSGQPDSTLSARAAASLSRLTAQILHKDAALTSIAITYRDPGHWFVAGLPLSELGKSSFFLELRITDETNTAAEKGAYIGAVFDEMSLLLGNLHDVSYVHIHDARATAWGYGGKTQQVRAVSKQLGQSCALSASAFLPEHEEGCR